MGGMGGTYTGLDGCGTGVGVPAMAGAVGGSPGVTHSGKDGVGVDVAAAVGVTVWVGVAARWPGVGVLVGAGALLGGLSTAGARVGEGSAATRAREVGSGLAGRTVGWAEAVARGVTVGVADRRAASAWRLDAASPSRPRLYSQAEKRKRATPLPTATFLTSLS